MGKKEVKRLKKVKEIKLSVLELAMISVALRQFIAHFMCSDKEGEGLFEAYGKLLTRLEKECKP